jgi:hypothetical protein
MILIDNDLTKEAKLNWVIFNFQEKNIFLFDKTQTRENKLNIIELYHIEFRHNSVTVSKIILKATPNIVHYFPGDII